MADLIVTVSQLNEYLSKKIISDAMLKDIKVRGEITNFKLNSSGSAFFSLKDAGALINCIMFDFLDYGVILEDGQNVTVTANVNLYARDAKLQLIVRDIESTGIGELYVKLEKTKQKLYAEGLFEASRKKKLPLLPKTLGVVTSATGAAMHDIIQVAKRRYPGISITVYPARVQGEGAANDVVAGIEYFNSEGLADVIIVGRGGGSFEDLFAFNEEIVARAVAASNIPIVSAVGHEVDYTLADLAADMRAPTPSAAAEICVPDKEGLRYTLRNLKEKLANAMENYLGSADAKLNRLKTALTLCSPERKTAETLNALAMYKASLQRSMLALCRTYESELKLQASRLDTLNPSNTLKRGYAIVKLKDGRVASSVKAFAAGERANIYLYDGMAAADIVKIELNGDDHEEKI